MKCRHCGADLQLPLIDLGSAPPSNAYLTESALHTPEKWYPLRVLVCTECWLVQTEDYVCAETLFDAEYAYFSSFSASWLQHAERYVDVMVERFGLNESSHVIEIAANDGYLLRYVKARNIPCLGIEPTAATAETARAKGIDIFEDFFGVRLAKQLSTQGKTADLIVANNVLAHVPDINDFVSGFAVLLKPDGIATFEFPHLMRLIAENQFDTIYHEHFSYLSLVAARTIFERNGLKVFDVEELPTHGGSLRIFAQRSDTGKRPVSANVDNMLTTELNAGLCTTSYYRDFQTRANRIKNDFVAFLIEAASHGKKIVAYGAAAKGNTLINYAGVRPDLISYVVDRNPAKQKKYLPGSRISIVSEDFLQNDRPDYVVVLPWNLKTEVMQQLNYIRNWNGKFVVAIPELRVL
jgi:predicted TPR repeat methyltransferase